MEKVGIVIALVLAVLGLSLLGNLIMTPLVNWVIHFFRPDVVLTYWQVYGVTFVIGLITGGYNRGSSSSRD